MHHAICYGYLFHLVQLAGYPTFSSTLPSVGAASKVTAEDDMNYVRDKMLIPVLDREGRDVILFTHSYSGIPGSAASKGLSKAERQAQGKTTGVLGQIFLASIMLKGGDGEDVLGAFGGQYPPHIRPEPATNLLRCDDRVPPMAQDVAPRLADITAASMICQGMTSFTSPCPLATWDSDSFKGRIAYKRTLQDAAIPPQVQQMMIDGSGFDWVIRDIKSGHSAQVSQPEKLAELLVELAKGFEGF